MVDQMIRQARTQQEAADMQLYIRLSRTERARGGALTSNQKKQINRVRLRLLKAGLIQSVSKERLEALARQVYSEKPWWERWWMKARFRWAMFQQWRDSNTQRRRANRALKKISEGK